MELSDNLGKQGGVTRTVGTRYHFNDTYNSMMQRGVVTPRIYPCTEDGREDGVPVLMSRVALKEKRRKQGVYTFGTQMLLNPKGDSKQGFQRKWIRYYDRAVKDGLNIYIVCDPSK